MPNAVNSRGYRNKNPGNIRKSANMKWQGLADQHPDKDFATFKSHVWGIRAMAVLLINYQDKQNIRTVRSIINRWAPPVENNTSAYVNAVSNETSFKPDHQLDLHSHEHLTPLIKAIIKHELGGQPYDDDTINKGLELAGVRAEPKPLSRSREISAGTGQILTGGTAVVGTVITAAGDAIPVLQNATTFLESHWKMLAIVLGLLTVAIGIWQIGIRLKARATGIR